ncbi:MAG: hypothetical protein WAM77_23375 [Xanthobacteraceae bacterium]
MQIVTEQQVVQVVAPELVFSAVREAVIAAVDGTGSRYPGRSQAEMFRAKTGAAPDRDALGLKVGSYSPDNVALGIARHGSKVLLIDPYHAAGLQRAGIGG